METFAPVARFATLRLFLALACEFNLDFHHLDAKTAFLCAEIDIPIYMYLPEGFNEIDINLQRNASEKFTQPVLKLLKAIYGIKQAPRLWNQKFTKRLQELGFHRCEHDHSLWSSDTLMVLIYVDNDLAAAKRPEVLSNFKSDLCTQFEMTDMGPVSTFLNIQIVRQETEGSIQYGMKQSHYIDKIVEDQQMKDCYSCGTPLPAGISLISRSMAISLNKNDDSAKACDKTKYQNLVGSLIYLMLGSRPDIAFALSHLASFASDPSELHWRYLRRVVRYAKGTKDLVLWLDGRASIASPHHGQDTPIVGYSDADWASNKTDRRSVGAYLFFYKGSLISWCSKKQPFVSTSTCESEYMAASQAVKEAIWIQGVLGQLIANCPLLSSQTKEAQTQHDVCLYMDNMSAIRIAKNPEFYSRSKHIDITVHFIRQRIDLNCISLRYLKTSDMTADYLTKALTQAKFEKCRLECGLE